MDSGDKTNTSLSKSSKGTIDPRSPITANPSLASPPTSDCFPSQLNIHTSQSRSSESHPLSSSDRHIVSMATSNPVITGSESTPNFSLNAYASVTKLESGAFNDWKLCLTTVMGAHRLSKYILCEADPPIELNALDDHETNMMRLFEVV